ncbi:hypothetical protein Trydic_g8969 [Trypoxylus dichotomus]
MTDEKSVTEPACQMLRYNAESSDVACSRDWRKKCTPMRPLLDDQHIHSLKFVDDQVILTKDEDDIDYMFRHLKDKCAGWNLEMNMDKTQSQSVHKENSQC